MIRITSGLYKGRVLRGGKSPLIRPTMSKVKLTFFDILQNDIKEKIFLDGFAGSGNIGIEALSRGAEYVVFIDDLPEAARSIRHNVENPGGQFAVSPEIQVLRRPGESVLTCRLAANPDGDHPRIGATALPRTGDAGSCQGWAGEAARGDLSLSSSTLLESPARLRDAVHREPVRRVLRARLGRIVVEDDRRDEVGLLVDVLLNPSPCH